MTYCDKWPDGCIMCKLGLCDGKKETAEKNLELEANTILRNGYNYTTGLPYKHKIEKTVKDGDE